VSILDKLDEAEKAATPGAVRATADCASVPLLLESMDRVYIGAIRNWRDAELLVLMRNNIRALIEVARAARDVWDNECFLISGKTDIAIAPGSPLHRLGEALAKIEAKDDQD
jgi:hypothetical protein